MTAPDFSSGANAHSEATAIPGIPGLEAARPRTHIEALELDWLPPHLIVFGSGYVGLEMAQAYRRFGSRVTVIERGPPIMSREDSDVSDELQRILSAEGIQFLVAAEPLNVRGRSGDEVSVTVRTASGERTVGVPISWSPRGAFQTTARSDSRRPATSWTTVATLGSQQRTRL